MGGKITLAYTLETPEHNTVVTMYRGETIIGQVRLDMSRQPFVRPFGMNWTPILDGLAELGRMRLEREARERQERQESA